MPRETPVTRTTVLAISEATLRLRTRLAIDGVPENDEAFLLLDFAAYHAQKADLSRRKRASIEDHGEIRPRLLREERELEQEYAHVSHLRLAA
jgi:hypothetical protein